MKQLVALFLVVSLSLCQAAPSLFGGLYNLCRGSEWSAWSSRDSLFECSTVTRSRKVREGFRCVDEVESDRRCSPPDAFETASSINTNFFGRFADTGSFFAASNGNPPPIDLLFVIDKSGSIGQSDFNKIIEHIKELVDLFTVEISVDKTRVSAISYSSSNKVDLDFNFRRCLFESSSASKTCIKSEIDKIDFEGGSTHTTKALVKARDEAFKSFHGSRTNSHKVLFLVTDGRSNGNGPLVETANSLKNDDVEIYALGVTSDVVEAELRSIVSDPIPDHLFYYDTFNAVSQGTDILISMARGDSFGFQDDAGFFGISF
ncbi:matrilin-3-like [Saccoglossus kowalevskii]|uniref:Collagen alpha-1(XII) chain-like n=1 Tax=Saccoglossus kowalevskii TaxID=10224 RepID=A0ABM0GLX5_SACKO|nr:PREDICTED: collagen alpha-1(XII) chain-like [Saccoglossus kowalevskii]